MTDLKSNKKRKGHPLVINPVGEFCLPITLPDDPEWVAAFINAVRKLSNRSTWDYDASGDYIVLADRWNEIANQIQLTYQNAIDCAAEICEDGSCTEIGPFHPAITYYPNNPITQPGEEGDYASPPWITGAGFINADGNDAMVDPAAFLSASWETLLPTLLPSWNLEFEGAGEIDIQFLATIQGGAVWVYPDGNPLAGDLVSLEYSDITSLFGVLTLGELYEFLIQGDFDAFVVTHSVKFETAGPHSLTAQYFPTAELFEPPFVGIGGGLRSIQLCGGATVSEDIVVPYTIALDGDSLNLLADGIVVSEIPKTTLQSFLDKWVDTAGDTMTGTLVNTGTVLQQHRSAAGQVGAINAASGSWEFIRPSDGLMLFATIGANTARMRFASTYAAFYRADSGTGPDRGMLRVVQKDAGNTSLLLHNRAAGGVLAEGYDDTDKLRALLTGAGKWQLPGIDGYDYSSTTWRRQFSLAGDWDVETDALRRGAVTLSLSDFDGDRDIFRADYNPVLATQPRLAFFDGEGAHPDDLVDSDAPDLLTYLGATLTRYGLINKSADDFATTIADEFTAFEKCNAAYYMSTIFTALIQDTFDDMQTVTADEIVNNLIDAFDGLGPQPVNVLYQAFQAAYAVRVGILDDLTDPATIADMLVSADFDLAAFLSEIDGFAWAYGGTPVLLTSVISAAWGRIVPRLMVTGANVENAACNEPETFGCEDVSLDFRFGTLHGVQLLKGVVTPGVGIAEEVDTVPDPDLSGIYFNAYFDNCTHARIEIDLHADEPSYLFQVYGYIHDGMGGWTQVLGVYQQGWDDTDETWVLEPPTPMAVDRWAILAENEPSGAPLQRVIKAVRFYIDE